MRLAVFSDVHGNLAALEAVLADIVAEAVDEIVFAGDLCLVGPRPAECVDRVRDLGCSALYGNTDDWLLGRQQAPAHLVELSDWTNAQLDSSQRAWLAGLPFAQSVSFGGAIDTLSVVHANPKDVNQIVFPPEEEQVVRYGRVRQPDSDLDALLTGAQSKTIVFGHLHIPFSRSWGQIQLVNISSVSMPGDGDPRAKYGLFDLDNRHCSFEHKYVSFDYDREVAAYRTNKPPGWEKFLETIAVEGYVPQNV